MRLRTMPRDRLRAPQDRVVQDHAADDQQDQWNVKPARVPASEERPPSTSTCTFASVNFCVTPLWHWLQVASRLAGLTVERGSLDGRMLCTPWQLEQLATTTDPPCDARPR